MKTALNRNIYLAAVLIIFAAVSYGQNYKMDVSKGDYAIKNGNYETAVRFYSEAIKTVKNLDKSNLDLLYKLGFSQMQIKDYKNASVCFSRYINIAKNASADIAILQNIIQWKEWCDNETNNQQVQILPVNSSIYLTNMQVLNSSLNDLSITLDSRNEIILFTSNKAYFDDKKLIDIKTNLFKSEIQFDIVTGPIKMSAEINSLGEIISACLSSDNKTLYFTVATDNQMKADIYVCKYKNWKFDLPEKLPRQINSKYFDGYPSISSDGKSLYFVSDRPGGFGGKDIYVTRILPDGTWSEPYNLGKSVNTKSDEITPHIDKSDEILYFSSKGHPGNGGFDIFYSKLTNKIKWGEPINMVEPINSKSDDIAYVTTSDNNVTYFSSNRRGGSGNFDIYKAGKTKPTQQTEEKPLITHNTFIPKETDINPNNFDDFEKLVESGKQYQPASTPVVADNTLVKSTKVVNEIDKTAQKSTQQSAKQPQTVKQPVAAEKAVVAKNKGVPTLNKVSQNAKYQPVNQTQSETTQLMADNNTVKPKKETNDIDYVTQISKQQQPVQQSQPVIPTVLTSPSIANPVKEPSKTINITSNSIQASVVRPKNLPLNKDTAILNSTMRGLVFRVQLGAFRNHITVNSPYFNKVDKNLILEELSEEMVYKYTVNNFESISMATKSKLALRASGYPDAFLACYYNGKRITMDEALIMLDKKVNEKFAFYQN
jgi:hypothetical protein